MRNDGACVAWRTQVTEHLASICNTELVQYKPVEKST